MNRLHLLCNAHLDPVWQWEWEEGAAAAISTFRVAARFCEEYDNFVFNHNEAILYKWVEEYEPSLFKKIQELVAKGKWNIIGGWYLQPDCNMPSGESFVRQILLGRNYFKEKFGVEPTTAVSFDAFGHTRGLVQIMKKSGYDSYMFMRPNEKKFDSHEQDFIWVGYDGSEVIAHKIGDSYSSLLGHATEKISDWMKKNENKSLGMITWGVGNHGGGPSKIDLDNISSLITETTDFEIIHSTPEAYIKELIASKVVLPRYDKDLNAWAVGCYTSQIRIKQKHRLLENELYLTEKMLSSATMQSLINYPQNNMKEAFCDLMTSEFHDILPGTSVQPAEESSLRLMDHGLEIVSRMKARAFFALSAGQEIAKENEIPMLVYNPHPFKIKGNFECEFMLADQNWKDTFSMPVVYQNGNLISSQLEKENSNINLDWRKRVVFAAELEPSCMNRFDCRIEMIDKKPEPLLKAVTDTIVFKTNELEIVINCKTGLIDVYKVNEVSYLKENAFSLFVIDDNDDPWGMTVSSFRNVIGKFELMSKEEGTEFCGLHGILLDSVRVIEDGAVRTVIEAVFKYRNSAACITYKLPKNGTEVQIQVRVNWSEKSKMLKLSISTVFDDEEYLGQVAYGVEHLPNNGDEVVSQKWTALVSEKLDLAFTCINDGVYGSDCKDGELRVSLLRSAGYTGHPIGDKPIMAQDRYSPRIDQGERLYNFWFNAGDAKKRLDSIDREALLQNEKPATLSFFPDGSGKKPVSTIILEDEVVQMTALKKAENSDEFIIRLFEPTGIERVTTISIPVLGLKQTVKLQGFEIKTYKLNVESRSLVEVDLMEN